MKGFEKQCVVKFQQEGLLHLGKIVFWHWSCCGWGCNKCNQLGWMVLIDDDPRLDIRVVEFGTNIYGYVDGCSIII